jgi:hypothetical protein
MKNILVMTATITPKSDAFGLARANPELRRRDYELALRYYLNELSSGSFEQLVFAENSDTNLGWLRALVDEAGLTDKVEFLSLYGLDYPSEYSRGYGEFLLLDRVMNTPLMRAQSPDSIVWKVTGRYRIVNIKKLIRKRAKQFDFYCNCRNYPMRLTDQYMLAWRVGVYAQHLNGLCEYLKKSGTTNSEELMREIIDQGCLRSLQVVPRFTHTPIIEGVRGVDNQEYSSGLKNRAKLLTRQIANHALPWLWI